MRILSKGADQEKKRLLRASMACVSKAMNMCRSLVTQLHMNDICSIYGVWVMCFGLDGVLNSGVGIEMWIFGVLYIYVLLYICGAD